MKEKLVHWLGNRRRKKVVLFDPPPRGIKLLHVRNSRPTTATVAYLVLSELNSSTFCVRQTDKNCVRSWGRDSYSTGNIVNGSRLKTDIFFKFFHPRPMVSASWIPKGAVKSFLIIRRMRCGPSSVISRAKDPSHPRQRRGHWLYIKFESETDDCKNSCPLDYRLTFLSKNFAPFLDLCASSFHRAFESSLYRSNFIDVPEGTTYGLTYFCFQGNYCMAENETPVPVF